MPIHEFGDKTEKKIVQKIMQPILTVVPVREPEPEPDIQPEPKQHNINGLHGYLQVEEEEL
jgi:hypothetical protein